MIYADLDDVLGETSRMFVKVLERNFGKKVDYEQLRTFDLAVSCGLSESEYREFFRLVHLPENLLQIAPALDAKLHMEKWTKGGHRIAIVTGRPGTSYEVTAEWLTLHKFPHNSLILVNKYDRDSDCEPRVMSLAGLGRISFSVAIEDSLVMASYLANAMNVKVALHDRPWNQNDFRSDKIVRCYSWQQIDDLVCRTAMP